MSGRLDNILIYYEELVQEFDSLSVTEDQNRFRRLMKEQADLTPLVETYTKYKKAKQVAEDSLALLEEEFGEEVRGMLKEELSGTKKRIEELEQELKILLFPKDPNDDRNTILEIRAGAGGDGAALFASELYRMYYNYADDHRRRMEPVGVNENGIGGFKEVVAMITGQGAYSKLEYGNSVHRVQRMPETGSGGHIHTFIATAAVVPEAEDVDIITENRDCRIDVIHAPGNGGQCISTTDSTVRLTHIPTGIAIYSQARESQSQNKEKAFRLLRSKFYDIELGRHQNSEAEEHRSRARTGDHSERIRTYNLPRGRVTDHRINLTLYKLDKTMNNDIQKIINACIAADQTARLVEVNEM